MSETKEILQTHEILATRYASLLLTHEYFCCRHDAALARVYEFLGLDPLPPANPRNFLKQCGRCGREFTVIERDQQQWLACPRHLRPVMGCGRFNPLRPLDRDGVLDASWKESADVAAMMTEVRRVLGDGLADYFWNCDYGLNLQASETPDPPARRVISAGRPAAPELWRHSEPFARSVDRRRRLPLS